MKILRNISMTEADQMANQMLQTDGYFVVSSSTRFDLGDVLDTTLFSGSIVIISETTEEEYIRQAKQMDAQCGPCYEFFYKAVAE